MKNIILCGCGALGSHIVMGIVRLSDTIFLYDDDVIEDVNITTGTTIYSTEHIGRPKSSALARILVRKFGATVYPSTTTIKKPLILLRPDADLIVDCFDNIEARSYTVRLDVPTVHISIGEQGLGAIEWNDVFQLPSEGYARGENPVCTNELGRNLILFTSAVASVIINKYLSTGVMESAYVNVDSLEIFR